MKLEQERLQELARQVHDNAMKHGWHEEKLPADHYLSLVMTEVAEAEAADRKGYHANTTMFDGLYGQPKPEHMKDIIWKNSFELCIKDTVEDEFADVVIRLLDMAHEIHGDKMVWLGDYPCGTAYRAELSFPRNAWHFVKDTLDWGMMNITDSVAFMYDWAEHLGVDLDRHVEMKMRYNTMRPYKHGGKKY